MHSFKAGSHTWEIAIHVAAIKRVRERLGIDLYKLLDDDLKPLGRLLAEPVALIDVIYVLCEAQAKAAGVSDEGFGEAMAGDVIEAARDAFLAEFVDFFPRAQARTTLHKAMDLARRTATRTVELAAERAGQTLATVDVEAEAEKLLKQLSGGSPASSASIPSP